MASTRKGVLVGFVGGVALYLVLDVLFALLLPDMAAAESMGLRLLVAVVVAGVGALLIGRNGNRDA